MSFLSGILQAIGVGASHPAAAPAPTSGWAAGTGGGGWASQLNSTGGWASQIGGGGWASALGANGNWATGGNAATQQDPLALAQQQLPKEVAYAGGNPAVLRQAQQVASGHHTGGGFLGSIGHVLGHSLSDALSVLDYPRAAVVSLLDAPNIASKQGGGWSGLVKTAEQIGHNIAHHEQGGTLIAHMQQGTPLEHSTFGKVQRSVGGLGVDVLGDPLTYVGGLGATTKAIDAAHGAIEAMDKAHALHLAAKGLEDAGASGAQEARTAANEAAAAAEKVNPNGVVTKDTLGRLITQGPAGLFNEEKTALGVKTGVGIRKLGAHGTRILPSYITDPVSRAAHEAGYNLRSRAAMTSLAKKIMPHPDVLHDVHQMMREGDVMGAYDKLASVRASALIPGVRQQVYRQHFPEIQKGLQLIKSPEEEQAVRHALDTGTGAGVEHPATAQLRQALDRVKADLEARGVSMGSIENYFPHQITDAAKKVASGPRKGMGGRFSHELARTLKPGEYFLGHQLQEGSVNEINRIMEEEGQPNLFKTDLTGVLDGYLHGAANRAAMQEYANRLADMGVTHTGDVLKEPGEWEKLAASGAFNERYASPAVKDAIQQLHEERVRTAQNQPGFTGKKIDALLGTWRKLALAMPGKALRHMFAQPAWAHYIGQVSPRMAAPAGAAWHQFLKGGVAAVKDPQQKKWLAEFDQLGLQHGHGIGHGSAMQIATEDIGKGATLRKTGSGLNLPGKYFNANAEVQARVQDWSRYIMFADARKKGLSDFAAAKKVKSLMGNPGDLTDWEKNVARRVVPFYAFLRTMLPAQAKALAHTPAKFLNVVNTQNEIAGTQTPPQYVPSYFADELLKQSPLHSGANPLFMAPDFPFARMNTTVSQPFSELNPLLQIVLEQHYKASPMTGQQFSPTDKAIPGVLQPFAGLLDKLGLAYPTQQSQTDFGVTTPAGTQKMSDLHLNELENVLPTISQMVDLFDGQKKTGGGTAGDITNLLGVVRAAQDTPTQQASVLWQRYFAIQQLIKEAQNRGELPSYIRGYKAP